MKKKRAVLSTGNSVTSIKRGPIRDNASKANEDLKLLEKAYAPHKGAVISEGTPTFTGDTDPMFDE